MKLLSLSLNPMFYSLAAQPPTVALSGEAAFSFLPQTFWLHIVPAWRCIKNRRSRGPKGRLKEGGGQETRGAGQSRLNSSVLARWGWGWRGGGIDGWMCGGESAEPSAYIGAGPQISWFFAPIANRARLPLARESRHNARRRAAISRFWKLGYIGKYSAAIRSVSWADEAQLRDVSGFSHCWPRRSSLGVTYVEWWLRTMFFQKT